MLAGLLLSLALISGPSPAFGFQSDSIVAVRARRLILRPGRELLEGTVLLERGVVSAVGKDLAIPEGARVIEGEVACAGFVDPWSSLGLDPASVSDLGTSPSTRSADALDPWLLPETRRQALGAGVTSARLQIGRDALLAGVGALVHTWTGDPKSIVLPDACVASAVGVTRAGRSPDVFDRVSEVDRLVAALEKARRYRESQVEFKAEIEKWTKAILEKTTELEKDFKKAKKDREKEEKEAKEKGKEFKEKKHKEDKKPRAVRKDDDDEALARAVEGELPLVVEVHRASEIRRLLEKTEPFDRLRLVIAGATESGPFAAELVERSIPVILWPVPMGSGRPDEYDGHDLALAGTLAREGVRVLIGSGGSDASHDLRLLAAMAVGHGMDPESALAAITTIPAQVFDVEGRLGEIELGATGDLLVFDGDPLDTSTNLRFVLTRGQVVLP